MLISPTKPGIIIIMMMMIITILITSNHDNSNHHNDDYNDDININNVIAPRQNADIIIILSNILHV